MAARKRLAAVAVMAIVMLTGCTYSAEEPGLFPTRVPSPDAETTADQFPPQPTDPELPVAGEAVWTTGDGLDVTVRFAVHAVRRIPGATVLDWSVTPISSPVARFGDALPAHLDLGLSQSSGGDADVILLDSPSRTAYAPLSNRSRRSFNHCLCSPMWLVQQRLRIGGTQLMQVAYPELPPGTAFVDVIVANVMPFVHVPVTPVGMAPTATAPTDLARPAERARPAAKAREVRVASLPQRALTIQIDTIQSSPGLTSVAWTLRAVTDLVRPLDLSIGPLVSRPVPDSVVLVQSMPTDGLVLKLPAGTLTNAWLATRTYGLPSYECLCSDLGIWARALSRAGGSLQVTSLYPGLPAGTTSVDVGLPGNDTVRAVPVVVAPDSAARLGPTTPRTTNTWYYSLNDPPMGWATADWPTDVPDSTQLAEYRTGIHRVVKLPGW